jgi:hypothetical protein
MALTQGNAFLGKYGAELIQTANALVAEGKGILAADESTGTVGKRVCFHYYYGTFRFCYIVRLGGRALCLGTASGVPLNHPKTGPFYVPCQFDDSASVIYCHRCSK